MTFMSPTSLTTGIFMYSQNYWRHKHKRLHLLGIHATITHPWTLTFKFRVIIYCQSFFLQYCNTKLLKLNKNGMQKFCWFLVEQQWQSLQECTNQTMPKKVNNIPFKSTQMGQTDWGHSPYPLLQMWRCLHDHHSPEMPEGGHRRSVP